MDHSKYEEHKKYNNGVKENLNIYFEQISMTDILENMETIYDRTIFKTRSNEGIIDKSQCIKVIKISTRKFKKIKQF